MVSNFKEYQRIDMVFTVDMVGDIVKPTPRPSPRPTQKNISSSGSQTTTCKDQL